MTPADVESARRAAASLRASHPQLSPIADVIDRLAGEVDRLGAAGDGLANSLDGWLTEMGSTGGHLFVYRRGKAALDAWEAVMRGEEPTP
jgi:hypothetical protein